MELNIRVAGEAGQGVQTAGDLLVGAFASMGLHLFSTQSYMSRIRGGLNWYDIRIADAPLSSGREDADILVALTEDALAILREHICPECVALFDGDSADGAIAINFAALAKEVGAKPLMGNSVAAGAVFGLLGYETAALEAYLEKQFGKHGEEAVELNRACARRGAQAAREHDISMPGPSPSGTEFYVTTGTQATALGAAVAGVKFVAAYPMTPSTGVFTWLAGAADNYDLVVEQAEDEIAAVNMICGATYTGVPALATTSGGGFALMVEGVSLAGMMELPIVILLSQRPGPATGLPTRTGQEDLRFALHAGHGEFPRAIFAPGTVDQCHELMRTAFTTSHQYQSPVIFLLDQFLADVCTDTTALETTPQPIDRHIITDAGDDYRRYAVTEDGISPRAIPGGEALVVCDSDEHDEHGHITESFETRIAMHEKRLRKHEGLLKDSLLPDVYGEAQADIVLMCWGSTYGPCREALERLAEEDHRAAMLHFTQLWPLRAGEIKALLDKTAAPGARLISVEGNATGQLASILRENGVLGECEHVLRYDGMPFTGEEIARRVASD